MKLMSIAIAIAALLAAAPGVLAQSPSITGDHTGVLTRVDERFRVVVFDDGRARRSSARRPADSIRAP